MLRRPHSLYGPNGLAYDPDNDRIYFAVVPNDCVNSAHNAELFFLHGAGFSSRTSAGALDECPHDATFFEDAYYYLGPDHNDLIEVLLKTDGTMASQGSLGDVVTGETLIFGDIAAKLDAGDTTNVPTADIGKVFMSATGTVSGANTWVFKITDAPPTATCLDGSCAGGAVNLQLAFQNNGFTTVLYGYENATRTIFVVDESDGSTTLACDADTVVVMSDGFNDTSTFETNIPPPAP
jgi:hypothetical protein